MTIYFSKIFKYRVLTSNEIISNLIENDLLYTLK